MSALSVVDSAQVAPPIAHETLDLVCVGHIDIYIKHLMPIGRLSVRNGQIQALRSAPGQTVPEHRTYPDLASGHRWIAANPELPTLTDVRYVPEFQMHVIPVSGDFGPLALGAVIQVSEDTRHTLLGPMRYIRDRGTSYGHTPINTSDQLEFVLYRPESFGPSPIPNLYHPSTGVMRGTLLGSVRSGISTPARWAVRATCYDAGGILKQSRSRILAVRALLKGAVTSYGLTPQQAASIDPDQVEAARLRAHTLRATTRSCSILHATARHLSHTPEPGVSDPSEPSLEAYRFADALATTQKGVIQVTRCLQGGDIGKIYATHTQDIQVYPECGRGFKTHPRTHTSPRPGILQMQAHRPIADILADLDQNPFVPPLPLGATELWSFYGRDVRCVPVPHTPESLRFGWAVGVSRKHADMRAYHPSIRPAFDGGLFVMESVPNAPDRWNIAVSLMEIRTCTSGLLQWQAMVPNSSIPELERPLRSTRAQALQDVVDLYAHLHTISAHQRLRLEYWLRFHRQTTDAALASAQTLTNAFA